MIRRHFFLFAALGALVLMAVAGGLKIAASAAGQGKAQAQAGAAAARATTVTPLVVAERAFTDRIEAIGVAKGRQSVTITSNTTELITDVHFRDGQRVAKGQVLVDLKAQAPDAAIAQAEATLALAQSNHDRWRALAEKGVAPRATAEQYKTTYDQALAALRVAQANKLDRVIRAPFSGVVGLSDVAPGTLINAGTPIVSLDDVAVMRVDFDVPDRYAPTLREGLPIVARPDAYPGQKSGGVIAKLDSRVNQNTRSIRARAEFPNPDGRLKPGMMLRVAVEHGQRRAVGVPEAAVQFETDQPYVFVIAERGGKLVAEQRGVVAGVREDGFIEIREGLKAGDRIVADGVNRVQPNAPLRLVQGAAAPVAARS